MILDRETFEFSKCLKGPAHVYTVVSNLNCGGAGGVHQVFLHLIELQRIVGATADARNEFPETIAFM